jgi:hypothetical protein
MLPTHASLIYVILRVTCRDILFHAANITRQGYTPQKFFDTSHFCDNQYSADYCFGSLNAEAQLFPHEGNKTRLLEEMWNLVLILS